MACSQTLSGLIRDCAPNAGGLRKVWIANATDISSVDMVDDNVISGFIMDGAKKFKEYAFARGAASLTSNWQVNAENGTKYVDSDLVLVFNRMDSAKRIEILALMSAELVIVAEDANGKRWCLGAFAGGSVTDPVIGSTSTGDGLTGTARADRNGYSITFHWSSIGLPLEVFGTVPV